MLHKNAYQVVIALCRIGSVTGSLTRLSTSDGLAVPRTVRAGRPKYMAQECMPGCRGAVEDRYRHWHSTTVRGTRRSQGMCEHAHLGVLHKNAYQVIKNWCGYEIGIGIMPGQAHGSSGRWDAGTVA